MPFKVNFGKKEEPPKIDKVDNIFELSETDNILEIIETRPTLGDDIIDIVELLMNENWLHCLDDAIDMLKPLGDQLNDPVNKVTLNGGIEWLQRIRKACQDSHQFRIQQVINVLHSMLDKNGEERIIQDESSEE